MRSEPLGRPSWAAAPTESAVARAADRTRGRHGPRAVERRSSWPASASRRPVGDERRRPESDAKAFVSMIGLLDASVREPSPMRGGLRPWSSGAEAEWRKVVPALTASALQRRAGQPPQSHLARWRGGCGWSSVLRIRVVFGRPPPGHPRTTSSPIRPRPGTRRCCCNGGGFCGYGVDPCVHARTVIVLFGVYDPTFSELWPHLT